MQSTAIHTAFDSLTFALEVDEWSNKELIARFQDLYFSLTQAGIRAYSDEIMSRMGFDALNEAVARVGR